MHYSGVDFLKRTITALLFASVILFCILKGKVWFTGLFALCTLLATVEFTGLSNRYKKCNASPIWSAVTVLLFYGAIAYTAAGKGSLLWFSSFILSLIIVFVREIYMKRPSPMADIAYTLFPILYIALPYALLSVLAYRFSSAPGTYSATIPLTLFIFLWCNDVGAYCIGCTIGRHKLFERISPKKNMGRFYRRSTTHNSSDHSALSVPAPLIQPSANMGLAWDGLYYSSVRYLGRSL